MTWCAATTYCNSNYKSILSCNSLSKIVNTSYALHLLHAESFYRMECCDDFPRCSCAIFLSTINGSRAEHNTSLKGTLVAEWQVLNTMTWLCHDISGTLKANHRFTYLNLCNITCWAGRCGTMLQSTTTAMLVKLGNFNMPGLQMPKFSIHLSIHTGIQKGILARFKEFSTLWL